MLSVVLDSLLIEMDTTRKIALGLKRDFLKRVVFCLKTKVKLFWLSSVGFWETSQNEQSQKRMVGIEISE